MVLKCLICASEFPARTDPVEFHGIMKNIFATFSNYLVPDSSLRDDRRCSQLCSSCRCQHLKPLHNRHIKMANLRARNTQTVAQFRTILQNVSTEPQKVQDTLSSGKAEKSLRSVWETTAGNDALMSPSSRL